LLALSFHCRATRWHHRMMKWLICRAGAGLASKAQSMAALKAQEERRILAVVVDAGMEARVTRGCPSQ